MSGLDGVSKGLVELRQRRAAQQQGTATEAVEKGAVKLAGSVAPDSVTASSQRRSDFKGARDRMTFRVDHELALQLELLHRAQNVVKNDYVEELLRKALPRSLANARKELGDEAFEALARQVGLAV